ncbi:hypothetical protein CQA53_00360 [Helicobacter didelphidarum]|uniref:Uncharacterized protein n=1 Tax=Helicobacter didelphidarum TaxID=2040648 RepID=A0A3D8IRI1_9HELI|nr:hypothetical protein [Helicobacter didelphidarum]RDU67515.1 hypothetical protein CQA53_00360 [Helicobacter didelphidarum]
MDTYSEWNLEMFQAKVIKYVVSKTVMSGEIANVVEYDNRAEQDFEAIDAKQSQPQKAVNFNEVFYCKIQLENYCIFCLCNLYF